MRKIVLGYWFCFVFCNLAHAEINNSYTNPQDLAFGKATQLEPSLSISIPAIGGDSTVIGGNRSDNNFYASVLTFFDDINDANETHIFQFQSNNATFSINSTPGCTVTISNVVVDLASAVFSAQTLSNNVTVGATLNIAGFCDEGSYSGYITMPYSVTNTQTEEFINSQATIPFSFEIETRLEINSVSPMHFGKIVVDETGGTVIISTDGNHTVDGAREIAGSDFSNGEISISGVKGRTIYMSLSPQTVSLTAKNVDVPVTVDNFNFSPQSPYTLNGENNIVNQIITIGATLHFNPNQPAGRYSGYFNVNITY